MEEYLTVEQIAAALQLHKQTVIRHIQAGRLHAVKVGKKWRISRASYDAFLQQLPQT